MVRVAATTAIGLEPVLREEAGRFGAEPVEDDLDFRGWQVLEVDDLASAVRLMSRLRTAHRLGPILAEGRVDPADPWTGMSELVADVDLDPWVDEGTTFAVRCKRRGDQPFTSVDVEARVGGFVDDRLAGHVDLEDPDLLLRVQVDPGNRVVVWVDLVGYDALHKRRYRVWDHPAGMKTNIAAGLLQMAGWAGDERLVDPMCGGGTVAIEAAWMTHEVPVTQLRRDELVGVRLPALSDLDLDALLPTASLPDDDGCRAHPPIRAGDVHEPHVDGSRGNARAAGVEGCLELAPADVRDLPERIASADLVATNPPYGIRSGSGGSIEMLYDALIGGAASILTSGGRVAVMTPREKVVRSLAAEHGFEIRASPRVHHGNMPIRLFVLG